MKPHKVNKSNNFIAGWYADKDICDEIINYHIASPNKRPGTTSYHIDKKRKDSTDVCLEGKLFEKYGKLLTEVAQEYIKTYPACNNYAPWGVTAQTWIQHYKPYGGFFEWHTERTSADPVSAVRTLVFMTYLNDVTDGGETEFLHQKLKIKPEKGLTLIWPADWTFTHRGITSPTQDKYIVTGWLSYLR